MWKLEPRGFFYSLGIIGIFVRVKNLAMLDLQQQQWDQAALVRGDVDGEGNIVGCHSLPACAEVVWMMRNPWRNYLLSFLWSFSSNIALVWLAS